PERSGRFAVALDDETTTLVFKGPADEHQPHGTSPPPSTTLSSSPEGRDQILRPIVIGMVGDEMAAHLFNDLLIFVRPLDRVEQLIGDVPVQRQLAPAWSVDRLRMIRIEHD